MIVIIDFKMGNLRSIEYKLKKNGIEIVISSDPNEIERADKLILPGVGHFATGMNNLSSLGLIPMLHKKVLEEKTPIMGICVGMQLFTKRSEEGNTEGLGWIDAETKRFNFKDQENGVLRVPHVGWNTIDVKKSSPMLEKVDTNARFYFTHSYYIECYDKESIIATTNYGYEFTSMFQKDNIYGTQFHTEKSHRRGLKLVENFAESPLI